MPDHIYIDRDEWLQTVERLAHAEAELAGTDEYRKEGESLVECLERNRRDAARFVVEAERWKKHCQAHGLDTEYDPFGHEWVSEVYQPMIDAARERNDG